MLFQGSIQRFKLTDILRFLGQIAATGVLEVRDFEEYGFIYFVEGRVQAISLPLTEEKLGTRLVKAGCLTQRQLAEALMEDSASTHDEKKLRPLGQRLFEKGFATEALVREIMDLQVLDQVFELAHWRAGVFVYDEPEEMPYFRIPIRGDVQELLLEAQRRTEEGEQARKSGKGQENEVCYMCPLESECTAAIKTKYLKVDICLWRTLSSVAGDDYDRLRDSRQLYRSKDDETKTDLKPSL
jgi:Domain of unknown function (DUF4388)